MILIYGKKRNLTIKSQEAIDCESTRFMNKGNSWQNIKGEKRRQEKTTSKHQSTGFTTKGWQIMPPLYIPFWHNNYFKLKALSKNRVSVIMERHTNTVILLILWGVPVTAQAEKSLDKLGTMLKQNHQFKGLKRKMLQIFGDCFL